MRVVVVDFAASEGGALSVLKDFVSEIKKQNDDSIEWFFILSDYYFNETKNIKIIIQPKSILNRLKFDFINGRKIIEKIKPNLVISMQNTYIYGIKAKQYIYLHQAIPFQREYYFSLFSKKERKYWFIQNILGTIIKIGIKRADLVLVQTNWLKNYLKKYNKIEDNKILILPPFLKQIDKKNFKIERTENDITFFYPTSDDLYKNNEMLIDVFNQLCTELPEKRLKLILTIEEKKEKNVNTNIEFLGRITREEVLNIMNNSILVFPSSIETYGLPLLEARQLGSFIIAGDTDFSREILIDYKNVLFFNLSKKEELYHSMEQYITGKIKKIEKTNDLITENGWKKLLNHISGE